MLTVNIKHSYEVTIDGDEIRDPYTVTLNHNQWTLCKALTSLGRRIQYCEDSKGGYKVCVVKEMLLHLKAEVDNFDLRAAARLYDHFAKDL